LQALDGDLHVIQIIGRSRKVQPRIEECPGAIQVTESPPQQHLRDERMPADSCLELSGDVDLLGFKPGFQRGPLLKLNLRDLVKIKVEIARAFIFRIKFHLVQ
jgi:hypothetical protein